MENDFALGYAMGNDSGGSNSNDGFGGGGWGGLLGLIVVASLFGLGRNGGSMFGGGGGGGGELSGVATRADINAGFQFQDLQNGIRGLTNGLSDSTYALNNSLTNGFHNVDRGLCDLGYALKDCCCQTQRSIDNLGYNMQKSFCDLGNLMYNNTRDIMEAQNNGTRAILDFLVTEKLSAKDARIAQLENRTALDDQSKAFNAKIDSIAAEFYRRTGHDYPVSAYLVQPPTPVTFPTNGCGTVQFGNYNNNCGCGCGNGYTL